MRLLKKETPLTIGGVKIPYSCETLQFLLVGATGTGKTTAEEEIVTTLGSRPDARMIIVDPGGNLLSKYYKQGDKILNPFDRRSEPWSIFNEVRKNYDCDRLAKSIVPDGVGGDKSWHHYAQVLISETMLALAKKGEATTEALIKWVTQSKVADLENLLLGTAASGLFDENAAKALASTRFVATSHLNPHKYLRSGEFSLRSWLTEEKGSLFITFREDMAESLKPLIGCWVDVIANAVLSLNPDHNRRLCFLLDELPSLGRVNAMESLLVRGRKFGVCVFGMIQSTSQLDYLYGREQAIVLRSCFRNLLVLGGSKTDFDTAEELSKGLGEVEVDRTQYNSSSSLAGPSKGRSLQRVTERLVLPNEIAELPNLEGFFALAGNHSTKRICLSPQSLRQVVPPFEEDE